MWGVRFQICNILKLSESTKLAISDDHFIGEVLHHRDEFSETWWSLLFYREIGSEVDRT